MTGQSSDAFDFPTAGMSRGRSESPHRLGNNRDSDEEMRSVSRSSLPRDRDGAKQGPKVVIVLNLTRNVANAHLRAIFGLYGEIRKIDLPVHTRCTSFLRGLAVLLTQTALQRSKVGGRLLSNLQNLIMPYQL